MTSPQHLLALPSFCPISSELASPLAASRAGLAAHPCAWGARGCLIAVWGWGPSVAERGPGWCLRPTRSLKSSQTQEDTFSCSCRAGKVVGRLPGTDLLQDMERCCWMLPRPAGMEESLQHPQLSSAPPRPPPWLSISLGSSPGRGEPHARNGATATPPLVAPLPGRGTSFPLHPSTAPWPWLRTAAA